MYRRIELTGQMPLNNGFAGQTFDVKSVDFCSSQALSVTVQLQWAQENAIGIEAFNNRIKQIGSPAQRLHRWRMLKHHAV